MIVLTWSWLHINPIQMSHKTKDSYFDCRYISASDAKWRLSEYKLYDQSHKICRMAIHLPDQQRVYYREGQQKQMAERAEGRYTHLTTWFRLNRKDPNARQFLYSEIYAFLVPKMVDRWSLNYNNGTKMFSIKMYATKG